MANENNTPANACHCACATKRHVELEKLRFAHRANENSTSQVIKLTRSALPHWESHSAIIRTVADSCERLRTVAQHPANKASPPDPKMKREPYAMHSEKKLTKVYLGSRAPTKHVLSRQLGEFSCGNSGAQCSSQMDQIRKCWTANGPLLGQTPLHIYGQGSSCLERISVKILPQFEKRSPLLVPKQGN